MLDSRCSARLRNVSICFCSFSRSSLMRYAIVAEQDLREGVQKLARLHGGAAEKPRWKTVAGDHGIVST